MLKLFTLFLSLTLATSTLAAVAAPAEAVHARVAKAVAVEAQAQRHYQQWTDRKEGAATDIRNMKAMESWLKFQNKKYVKYIRKQEEVIAELERRKQEARLIRMELEPFLETVVDRLEEFVASDLPFLIEERTRRIRFLRSSLDDYRLGLSEKLRRVFEALQVEMEYGRNVSTATKELDLEGVPTQVSVFRLGRTALFYQTADGAKVAYWDRASSAWSPLDESTARTLHRAKDMADRKRAVELLALPVGAAQ